MGNLPKRIAIVYDWSVKWGGAEQVLIALHELYPDAPLFTSVYDEKKAKWAIVFPKIVTSFMQKIPFAKTHHELFPFLTSIAFESFNFSDYDLVISVCSADSKSIITSPKTLHVCYILTPTRYLWSHTSVYLKNFGGILSSLFKPVISYLRNVDFIYSHRPDSFISISNTVRERVKKYYSKDSIVIYPPVDINDINRMTSGKKIEKSENFLWVGRFVSYKNPTEIVKTFNITGESIRMIGDGKELSRVKKIAKKNVTFLGFIDKEQLVEEFKKSKGLIMFHEEDFGITSVESQYLGTPVIGLNTGGVSETVLHNKTGLLGDNLKELLVNFPKHSFSESDLKKNAEKFSKERFHEEFAKVIKDLWTKHQSIHMS